MNMRAIIILAAAIAVSSPAIGREESAADFFRKDKMYWSQGLKDPENMTYNDNSVSKIKNVSKQKRVVRRMVARQAEEKLGKRWIRSAVNGWDER